jgi:glycosyltransferase involved in cell wall biosynthesis
MAPLNILHVFRAPVGGLFRHVLDLARGQIARGHRVGIFADSLTGGDSAAAVLAELAPSLALGLSRHPMRRQPNPGDALALAHVMRRAAKADADVIHGHGAKGGAYARLAFNAPRAARAYTPHGGSLLYSHDSIAGMIYLATERLLTARGDLYLFESAYSEQVFRAKVGKPGGIVRVVHNGVTPAEFEPVPARPGASDLVFIGELRPVKGIDLLVDAVATLRREGRRITAAIVGSGPDREALQARVDRLELAADIAFKGAMPAREAFALGHVVVVPSRAESLPYVVLEAAAAGKPLIATKVGGIPEIYGPLADKLIPPQDAAALARAIAEALDNPAAAAETARRLREQVAANFSVESMVDAVLAGYRDALERLHQAGRR